MRNNFFVLGFLFNQTLDMVLLIRKSRPQWQCGLLNGVGGKVEKDESPMDAMVREFREETGAHTGVGDWNFFARMSGTGFVVDCFVSNCVQGWEFARSVTDEQLEHYDVGSICSLDTVPNVPWLVWMGREVLGGTQLFSEITY